MEVRVNRLGFWFVWAVLMLGVFGLAALLASTKPDVLGLLSGVVSAALTLIGVI